jgi:flavin-dependent dehydrogenase
MTVAATLALKEAAGRRWGAVVVGAGPAGATAARQLARLGVTTLLVERSAFPRGKVCGCCLNGRAAALLDGVGLKGLPARCGARPLRTLLLHAGGQAAQVALRGSVALSREAFDAALVAAAVEAGAAFLPQTRASLGESGGGERRVGLQQGESRQETSAAVVVAADGLGGRLLAGSKASPAARIGAGTTAAAAPAFYRDGVVFMTCGPGGYFGLVRLEDDRLDLAAAFDAAALRECGPGGAARRLLNDAGWPPPPELERLPWRGTPALTRRPLRLGAERVFAVGDAAGYIEPFTGEGMAWALAVGAAVAPLAMEAAQRWRPEMVGRWARLHRLAVGRRQYPCRAAAATLRRPWLTRLVVGALAHAPAVATPFTALLDRPLGGRSGFPAGLFPL